MDELVLAFLVLLSVSCFIAMAIDSYKIIKPKGENSMRYVLKYVRNEDGHPVGCVVATGPGQIGWSACHPNDRFNKELARRIAIGRAQAGSGTPELAVPWSKGNQFDNVIDEVYQRSYRYFKN
jgi:hypothetical protein